MSESIADQLPPLAPESEPETETTVEATDALPEETETPAKPELPEWSKPLQKMQMESANFRRDVMAALQELKDARTATQQQDATDELSGLLKWAEENDGVLPGLKDNFGKLTEKIREAMKWREELPQIRADHDFEAYMAGKPEGFREAYEEAQASIIAEAAEQGQRPTERETRLAMGVWAKQWMAANKTPKTAGTKTTTQAKGRGPVIPAPAALRSGNVDPEAAYAAGHVPDGKGGWKPGNKLGL